MSKTPGLFLFVLSISNSAGHADSTLKLESANRTVALHEDRENLTEKMHVTSDRRSLIIQRDLSKLRFHFDVPAGVVIDNMNDLHGNVSTSGSHPSGNLAVIEICADDQAADVGLTRLMLKSGQLPWAVCIPSMHFVGRSMNWHDGNHAVLNGYMTIGNTTRHVEFALELEDLPGDHMRKNRVSIQTCTCFKRSEFGMDTLTPLVNDDISLRIHFEAVVKQPRLTLVTSVPGNRTADAGRH